MTESAIFRNHMTMLVFPEDLNKKKMSSFGEMTTFYIFNYL